MTTPGRASGGGASRGRRSSRSKILVPVLASNATKPFGAWA